MVAILPPDTRQRISAVLSHALVRTAIRNGLLILAWYSLSITLSIYNKKLLGKSNKKPEEEGGDAGAPVVVVEDKSQGVFGKGAFPAPLLMSGLQFAFQAMLARLVFKSGIVERSNKPSLTWQNYWKYVVPNGVTTGLDIGFSNMSLVFITMSFYTMCKSTVPVFLLGFAFLWRIERPSWELAGVVCIICSGLVLLVEGETDFDPVGFALVMSASCLSGFRFTLTQVLLHGHQDTVSMGGPLEVLELLTPVMSGTMFALSLVWEKLWAILPGSPYFSSMVHIAITMGIILVGAIIAFLMVWAEYKVIKETSALTFMIAGTVKEVATVIAAVIIMGDSFGPVNAVGLGIVIMGVLLFNWHKYRRIAHGEIPAVRRLHASKHDGEDGGVELEPLIIASSSGGAAPASLGNGTNGVTHHPHHHAHHHSGSNGMSNGGSGLGGPGPGVGSGLGGSLSGGGAGGLGLSGGGVGADRGEAVEALLGTSSGGSHSTGARHSLVVTSRAHAAREGAASGDGSAAFQPVPGTPEKAGGQGRGLLGGLFAGHGGPGGARAVEKSQSGKEADRESVQPLLGVQR